MKYSDQLNYKDIKRKGNEVSPQDEKLKFSDMLNNLKVIDSNDRVRLFKDCIEQEFQEIANKVSEYNRDGKLQINILFKRDKKSKNGIDIYADVVKTIPKGQQKNPFYLDTRNGGLYFENPNQGKFNIVKPFMPQNNNADFTEGE